MNWLLYSVFGYLSGSILFARVFGRLFRKNITEKSSDQNPGAYNAFRNGGFACGALTLCGDLLKGFLPVYWYVTATELDACRWDLVLILMAPVAGHLYPFFHGFRGGKGIAVSFGCLLGLFPLLRPAVILAGVFIFLSVVVRVTPHYDRTLWTYRLAAVCMPVFVKQPFAAIGFIGMAFLINSHLRIKYQETEKCQVKLLWTR